MRHCPSIENSFNKAAALLCGLFGTAPREHHIVIYICSDRGQILGEGSTRLNWISVLFEQR